MKHLYALLMLALTMGLSAQTKVLHLNLNSHNETNDPTTYTNSVQYATFKPFVKSFADSVIIKQVKWNMQVETNFIQGVLLNEAAATSTVDFLQASDASPYIEVDVHHHSTAFFKHADVAKLLDSCGVAGPHNNVGGFLWLNSYYTAGSDADWTTYGNGVTGFTWPTYTWTPKVIWGAGSQPAHTNDFNAFGIWKPSGATASTFTVHNPTGNITYIGNGCDWHVYDTTNVQWIKNDFNKAMQYITTRPANANLFYTASIQTDFRYYATAGYVSKVFQIVNYIKSSSYSSSVVWETLTEKYNSWYGSHNSSASFFDNCTAYKSVGILDMSNDVMFSMYPNPATNNLTIEIGQFNFTNYKVSIYNALGQLMTIKETDQNKVNISLSSLQKGIYFVSLETKEGFSKLQKLIIE